MKKMCSFIAVLLLSSMLPAHATDNMKAFPPADQGKVRYVLQLPTQEDESVFKVELIVGKTVQQKIDYHPKMNMTGSMDISPGLA